MRTYVLIFLLLFANIPSLYGYGVCQEIAQAFFQTVTGLNQYTLPLIRGQKLSRRKFAEYYQDISINIKEYQNLDHLAMILSENKNPETVKKRLEEMLAAGKNVVSLSEFLPDHLKPLLKDQGQAFLYNCYNFALRKNNPALPIENTESQKFLNDTLYFKYQFLQPGANLKYGDILVFRDSGKDPKHNIKHMAIFISQDIILHKPNKYIFGPPPSPPIFETLESAIFRYNNPSPEGAGHYNVDDPMIQAGPLYIQAFRFK